MPLRYIRWITREMVQGDRNSVFLFGDNVLRRGYGGQAKAMRDEPNAIGIVTKVAPDMSEGSFFSDDNPHNRAVLEADLRLVKTVLVMGKTIFVPSDGLGTGLSQLPTRAPKLYATLLKFFRENSDKDHLCPWPDHGG